VGPLKNWFLAHGISAQQASTGSGLRFVVTIDNCRVHLSRHRRGAESRFRCSLASGHAPTRGETCLVGNLCQFVSTRSVSVEAAVRNLLGARCASFETDRHLMAAAIAARRWVAVTLPNRPCIGDAERQAMAKLRLKL
jgi:hypothetical protein